MESVNPNDYKSCYLYDDIGQNPFLNPNDINIGISELFKISSQEIECLRIHDSLASYSDKNFVIDLSNTKLKYIQFFGIYSESLKFIFPNTVLAISGLSRIEDGKKKVPIYEQNFPNLCQVSNFNHFELSQKQQEKITIIGGDFSHLKSANLIKTNIVSLNLTRAPLNIDQELNEFISLRFLRISNSTAR